jgi:fructose-bisphosphate aldolase class II
LKTQIGNPEGSDVPNKNITIQENGCVKAKWLSTQEQAFADLNNVNTL